MALIAKHENENLPLSNGNGTPPPPRLGRGTHNSQHAGLLPELMETSENDQKDNSLDNSTDKENTENGNKWFATKDPGSKYGRKNPKSSKEISTSRGTITIHIHSIQKVHRKKDHSSVCGAQMCSLY